MKTFLYILFFFLSPAGHSQKVIDVGKNDADAGRLFYTVAGEPFSMAKYVKVVGGSPYYIDSWSKGRLVLSGGRVYDSLLLRLDLLENSLQYISPDGREMVATTPISRVTFSDTVSGKEYCFVQSSFLQVPGVVVPGWYLLLAPGSATLYKRFVKTIQENRPYNSATTEQTIHTSGQYFIQVNATFSRIKKLNDLAGLLKDKKSELVAYINSRSLSGKTDADYMALVSYYNSLVKN